MSNRTNLSTSYHYTVTAAADNSAYLWSGHGLENAPNPTIYLRSDDDITITNDSGGHVMNLSSDDVSWGITESNGQIVLISDAYLLGEGSYTYVCSSHPAMTGKIKVSNPVVNGGPEDGYGTGLLPGNNVGGTRASVSVDQIRTKINEIVTKGGIGGSSVGTELPASASDGDLFYDTTTGALYIYLEDIQAWIQTNGGSGGGGGGVAYSSGWVSRTNTTFNHNLGTTDFVATVYMAKDASGTDAVQVEAVIRGPQDYSPGSDTQEFGYMIKNVTSSSLTLQLGENGIIIWNDFGKYEGVTSYTHLKVVAIAGGSSGTSGGASVTTGDTAPATPADGDLWFNTTTGELYVYIEAQTAWIQTNGGSGGGGEGASVTTGDTAPASPADGDLWFNTVQAELYVYLEAESGWIQTNGGGGGAGSGNFSTGWVDTDGTNAVANGATLTFDHNLGTEDLIVQAYMAKDASGTDMVRMESYVRNVASVSNENGYQVNNVTTTGLTVQLGANGWISWDSSGQFDVGAWGTTYTHIKVVVSSGAGSGPRAYVAFDGTATDLNASITNSFNITSLVDKGVGWYEVNYTNPVNNPVPTTTVESPSETNPHDSSVYNVTANSLEILVGFTALNGSGRHDREGVFLVVH